MKRICVGSVVITLLLSLIFVVPTFAAATLYTDQSTFTTLPGVVEITIPSSDTLSQHPFGTALTDYGCTNGSTGISLASGSVVITEAIYPDWICIIGPGWNAGTGNTSPTPTSPTIVANREDAYNVIISFADPVDGVGFKLLTNSSASETITLTYVDATTEQFLNSSLDTSANSFEFVGFKTTKAISQVRIDTVNGQIQNEGIAGIWVIQNAVPSVDAGGPYTANVTETKAIDGTASDPAGDSLTYAWTVVSSSQSNHCTITAPTQVDTSVKCTDVGIYTLKLTVSDGISTVFDTATVTVSDPYLKSEAGGCAAHGSYDNYQFIESKFVTAVGSGTWTPTVLSSTYTDPAYKYLIEASGVYYAGGRYTYDLRADAKWSQDGDQRVAGDVWTDEVHGYAPPTYDHALLELKVDGVFPEWGAFNSAHVYTIEKFGTGDQITFQFQISDIYAQNNTGGLCVALFKYIDQSPTIDSHGDVQAEATGPGGAIVTYDSPATHDDIDPDGFVTCVPTSGSTFPLGETVVNCSVTDSGEHTVTSSFKVTVVDTTAPVIAAHGDETVEATSSSGAVVNYTSPATSDAVDGAGVATCLPASGGIFALGDTTVNCNKSDAAGNVAIQTSFVVHVVDTTAPMITFVDRTLANGNGWNNSSVVVNWSCSDAVGVTSPTVSVTVSTEGSGQEATGTCEDTSGNKASDTQIGINIDKTVPTLNPSVSPNPVILNGSATANPGATDALSGIDSSSCDSVATTSVGPHTVACTATDKAGNVGNDSASYTVQYASGGVCYGGPGHTILQPINSDGSSVFKQKSTVPAKFRVCDANGNPIGVDSVIESFKLVRVIYGVDPETFPETVDSTTPDSAFRWSADGQLWIFNINTKNLMAGRTYYYEIKLKDGTIIPFYFGLK